MALEREMKTFEAHRAELLGRARGKFVLIKDDDVLDVFSSMDDALKVGYEKYGGESFLVKRIEDAEVPLNFTSFRLSPA